MTASLAPIPSAQPSAAPQASAASPDAAEVPFSQVLSGELAQQQRRSEGADGAAAEPVDTANTAVATEMPAGGKSTHRAGLDEDTQAIVPGQADAAPTLPDTMLALAMQPEAVQRPAAPPLPAEQTAASPKRVPGTAPETKTAARTAAGAAADPVAGRAVRAAGTAAATAGADAAHAATDPAVSHEKTAVAEALAKRLPEPARGAERLPEFAAALSAAQSAQPIAPTVAAAAGLHARDHLQPPVGAQAWNQALGERIVWMAAGGQQSATLTLNPPDLGPLQIVLNVSNDQASAGFFAAQPEVRQALEAALPRLREMMQDAGIQLGQTTVSADTPRQQDMRDSGPQRTGGGFAGSGPDRSAEAVLPPPTARVGRGLVDTFA
jgi:flagellar hook-length control protein FliK